MSTQQIVGAALTAVGAATGNWQLAIYGVTLATTPPPPDIEGPRLGDLKVQASTYGQAIPRVYGSMRVAGNVIWSTSIRETSHTSGGGKGGGPKTTTYTYSCSFAVALCEGEIIGVRKIWANGKLIYASQTASSGVIANGIRVYTGSETQTPDSLIEAHVGIGNAPAYRGVAYVVFEDMQLGDYGNRVPNLEFEVETNSTSSTYSVESIQASCYVNSSAVLSNDYAYINCLQDVIAINRSSGSTHNIQVNGMPGNMALVNTRLYVPIYDSNEVRVIDTNNETTIATIPYDYPTGCFTDGNAVYVAGYSASGILIINPQNLTSQVVAVGSDPLFIAIDSGGNKIFVLNKASNNVSVISGNSNIATVTVGLFPSHAVVTGTRLYVACDDGIYVVNTQTLSVDAVIYSQNWLQLACANGKVYAIKENDNIVYVIDGTSIVSTIGLQDNTLYIASDSDTVYVSIDNGNIVYIQGQSVVKNVDIGTQPRAITPSAGEVWVTSSVSGNAYVIKTTASSGGVSIGSIVSDICARVGIAELDTSQLTDNISGYVIPRRSAAKDAIDPLAVAFHFDAVESDGVLKFVKRGGQNVTVIPSDDIGAHEYGSEQPEPVAYTRQQEVELPREVTVSYIDANASYAIGTQYARRITGASQNATTIQLPMAIPATKAKEIADVMLYDAWQGRVQFTFSTTLKYSHLEPSDLVQIEKGGTYFLARIIDKMEHGGVITFTAVHDDQQIYNQNAVAPSIPAPPETVEVISQTELVIMDIPALRDQDANGMFFYVAACGSNSNEVWRGAQIYKSIDGGASWVEYGGGLFKAATIGTSLDALGVFAQNIVDEHNQVKVVLKSGELSSCTIDALLNGANAALLGDEIIQFRDADLVAPNTYVLSGLLRGRRGTEWAINTHSAGERFVLLDAGSVYLMQADSSEIGVPRKYRGVSFGTYLEDAQTHTITYLSNIRKCYAPVHLGGGRYTDGSVILTWVRRSRVGGAWTDYADVPLGEEAERYDVEIYDGPSYNNVLRTYSGVTTQSVVYSAADQIADFGATQTVVYWAVYQVSAITGRGYVARGAT